MQESTHGCWWQFRFVALQVFLHPDTLIIFCMDGSQRTGLVSCFCSSSRMTCRVQDFEFLALYQCLGVGADPWEYHPTMTDIDESTRIVTVLPLAIAITYEHLLSQIHSRAILTLKFWGCLNSTPRPQAGKAVLPVLSTPQNRNPLAQAPRQGKA